MEIRGTSSAATTDLSAAYGGAQTLGKETFLQLLVTQMRYQDPLSPMENTEFLAQLAQFSSLEQMQNLNEKFDASMLLTQSLNNSMAAGLIGRDVRAAGDTVTLGDTGTVELGYFLPQEAETVTVRVYDARGTMVRTLTTTDTDPGAHRIHWDGADLDGRRKAAGTYTFEVSAADGDGQSLPVSSVIRGRVDGVTYKNGSAYLLVDGREVSLSQILEVYLPDEEGGDGK